MEIKSIYSDVEELHSIGRHRMQDFGRKGDIPSSGGSAVGAEISTDRAIAVEKEEVVIAICVWC
jgi:hypothetical protein